MELKSTFIAIFLLLLILAPPILSRDLDSDIYEIDYKGPETHSHVPPPNRSIGKPGVHHKSTMAGSKFKASRARTVGGHRN